MQKQLAIKIFTICFIAIILLFVVQMVKSTVKERQHYQAQAANSVSRSWTGPQLVVTPVLIVPYSLFPSKSASLQAQEFKTQQAPQIKTQGLSFIMPSLVNGQVQIDNSSVFKGIYEVPIYNSKLQVKGSISAEKLQQQLAKIRQTPNLKSIGTPYISIHISDMRGISNTPILTINNKQTKLKPGSQLSFLESGLHAELTNLLNEQQQSTKQSALKFDFSIDLKGMSKLYFIQLADDANMQMSSNWPHPSFIGAALPDKRHITSTGFTANWHSTRYSSNSTTALNNCVFKDNCHKLKGMSSGVNFIKPVDIYLQSERAVKYAILFIGLSFITFFIFENIKRVRIHPIQYAFVGLAISIFYLLLIALAEHIAFLWAYVIAVSFCSSLLLFYIRYMLRSLSSALLFIAMLLGLYSLLYVIIQAEDFAMLMGALLVFSVLSILMFVTRKFDWYQLTEIENKQDIETKVADKTS